MACVLQLVAASVAVCVALSIGAVAVVRLGERVGVSFPDVREFDTWHGRPIRQADRDVSGPQFGFLLFVAGLFVTYLATVFAFDAVFGRLLGC